MNSTLTIGLSGLQAATTRLSVSADNVVNAGSRAVEPVQRSEPGRTVNRDAGFQAMRVYQEALTQGGVLARPVPVRPAAVAGYSLAPAEAGVALRPNVSLEQEAVEQISARLAYEASARVIETADEMADTLLDILA